MDRDKNLLFGVMAVQLKKVASRQFTEAAEACAKEPKQDIGAYLVASGAMSEADRALIQGLVEEALHRNAGDPDATLDALGGDPLVDATFKDDTFKDATARPAQAAATVAGSASSAALEQIPAVQEHPGRYANPREFSSGGMGRILLVLDRHFGREVALKELLPSQLKGSATRTGAPTSDMLTIPAYARFVQEAKITGQLEHPSIIPVYELGYRADGSLYYTMKLVRGRTLQDAMIEAKTLGGRMELLTNFLDLCQAISYAHSRGVIHRDIKPKNVMVGEFGETVVIDWGIAKVRGRKDIYAKDLQQSVVALHEGGDAGTVKTLHGQALGSPYFMPPEQAQGKVDEIDERSDIYSLGAVLYTLLTGQLPFLGTTVRDFLKKVPTDPPKPLLEIQPDAPRELVAVCERAMQKDPAKRYQTAKELTEEIHRFLSGGLVRAYEYGYGELVGRFVRKHKSFLITAGTGIVVLLAVCVLSYLQVVKEKQIALEQRDAAVRAKLAEKQALDKESIAKQAAQQELYSSNIALSERCLAERRIGRARNLLTGCPDVYRQWEWGRLQYLCNADILTLKSGGYSVLALPGGTRIVLGSVDGTVTLADYVTGETLRTFAERGGYGTVVASSGSGARIAANGETAVTVWDAASGAAVFSASGVVPSQGQWPHCMALSLDGAHLAARVDPKTVKLWNVETQQELATLALDKNNGFRMVFSPDGKRLLMCAALFGTEGWENVFTLHDAATGSEVSRHVAPAEGLVHVLEFSPDGTSALMGTDVALTVWDVATWTKLAGFPAQIYYPRSVQFSPDGKRVAAGGKDGTLVVWDAAANAELLNVKAHLDSVHDLAFSPDGGRVVTASFDRTVKVWSVAAKRLLQDLTGHTGQVFCVAFSPDGTRVISGDYDGTTKVWAVDSDLALAQADTMDYAPSRGYLAGNEGNLIKLWDSQTGHLVRTFNGHSARVMRLAFDAAGKRLASVSREGDAYTVKLWDVDAGTETSALAPEMTEVSALAFSPDGQHLAIRGGTTLKMWNLENAQQELEEKDTIGFRFSPDGARLAIAKLIGKQDGTILLRGLSDGGAPAEFHVVVQRGTLCLAFSPDGALLAAESDDFEGNFEGTVVIWQVADGKRLGVLRGHAQPVTCAAFSPDGKRMATGGNDKQARLWDVAELREVFKFEGHAGNLRSVLFSNDGNRLVTASEDGTFRIWDCVGGRELVTLQDAAQKEKGNAADPDRAVFSPDGRQLIAFTEPQVLPPIVLHAFPWRIEDYPGAADAPLQDRIEQYKRQYWSVLEGPAKP